MAEFEGTSAGGADVEIRGQSGDDDIKVLYGAYDDTIALQTLSGPFDVRLLGGSNDDLLTVKFRHTVIGDDVAVEINAGSGDDGMWTWFTDVDFLASHTVLQNGGANNDYMDLVYRNATFAEQAGFVIDQLGDAGNDTSVSVFRNVSVAGSSFSQVQRTRSANGGAGNDVLASVNQRVKTAAPIVTTMDGEAGNDLIGAALINIHMKADQNLTMVGGDGNDFAVLLQRNVLGTAANLVTINGNKGDDAVLAVVGQDMTFDSVRDVRPNDTALGTQLDRLEASLTPAGVDLNEDIPPVDLDGEDLASAPINGQPALFEIAEDIELIPIPVPPPIVHTVRINTGANNDHVAIQIGELDTSVPFHFITSLGKGNDHYIASVIGDVGGTSRLVMHVSGDDGHDHMKVDIGATDDTFGPLTISAPTFVSMSGGAGNDHMAVCVHDAIVSSTLAVRMAGGQGHDWMHVSTQNVEVQGRHVISQAGGENNDHLRMTADGVTYTPQASFFMTQRGDKGNDTVISTSHSMVVEGAIPGISLGQRRRTASGGDGTDVVASIDRRFRMDAPVSTIVSADAGNDLLATVLINGHVGSTSSFAMSDSSGNDTAILNVQNVAVPGALNIGIDLGEGNDNVLILHGRTVLPTPTREFRRHDALLTKNLDKVHDTLNPIGVDLKATTAALVLAPQNPVPIPPPPGAETIKVDVGEGKDYVNAHFGNVATTASLDYIVDLGGGNDKSMTNFAGRVSGSQAVTAVVDGGNDHDAITVKIGNNNDTVAPQHVSAPMHISMNGDAGNDCLTLTIDNAVVSGDMTVHMNGGTGVDKLISENDNVTFGGHYEFEQNGAEGNDRLRQSNNQATFENLASFNIQQNGGEDNDIILSLNNGLVVQGPLFSNIPTVRHRGADGGAGNDIVISVDQRFRLGAQMDVTISGGTDNDFVGAAFISGVFDGLHGLQMNADGGDDIGVLFERNVGGPGRRAIGIDMGAGNDGLMIRSGPNATLQTVNEADPRDAVLRKNAKVLRDALRKLKWAVTDEVPAELVAAQAPAPAATLGGPTAQNRIADVQKFDVIRDIEPAPVPIPIPIPIPVPVAKQSIRVQMGAGDDRVSAMLRGVRSTALTINAGDDNDRVRASVSPTPPLGFAPQQNVVRAHVFGGDGDDDLSLKVGLSAILQEVAPETTADVVAAAPVVFVISFFLNGGDGEDTCQATPNVIVVNCEL